jgi:hypothetical protein
MIDLLLEKKYNIQHKYWFVDNFIVCEVSGEYLEQPCKFRKKLSCYDIASAKFDILEMTEYDLKNKLIKFITEKLDNNPLNVL